MAPNPCPDRQDRDEPAIADTFAQEADRPTQDDHDLSFSETAREQIALAEEMETALVRHDFRWQVHLDLMANQAEAAPALRPESDTGRSVTHEYHDRRSRWEAHREVIASSYEDGIADLRDRGETASDHFKQASVEPASVPSQEFESSASQSTMIDVPEPAPPEPPAIEPTSPEITPASQDFTVAVQSNERGM